MSVVLSNSALRSILYAKGKVENAQYVMQTEVTNCSELRESANMNILFAICSNFNSPWMLAVLGNFCKFPCRVIPPCTWHGAQQGGASPIGEVQQGVWQQLLVQAQILQDSTAVPTRIPRPAQQCCYCHTPFHTQYSSSWHDAQLHKKWGREHCTQSQTWR